MNKTAIALCTLPALALGGTALAKDMKGRFGLGGEADGTAGGLSMKYWVSDLGLQAMFNLQHQSFADPDGSGPLDAPDGQTGLGLSLRLLYNFARANDTNMYVGAGITLGVIDADKTQIDVVLGVEHFFTDYFSVAGHVGMYIDVTDETQVLVGVPATWGTSFHFYF